MILSPHVHCETHVISVSNPRFSNLTAASVLESWKLMQNSLTVKIHKRCLQIHNVYIKEAAVNAAIFL